MNRKVEFRKKNSISLGFKFSKFRAWIWKKCILKFGEEEEQLENSNPTVCVLYPKVGGAS